MAPTVCLTHEYDACPDRLWSPVTDLRMRATLSGGLVAFRGMPEGRRTQGQSLSIEVSALGRLPWRVYGIGVLARDDDTRRFDTVAHGTGIERPEHWPEVRPTKRFARPSERVENAAGWLPWPLSLWAPPMYRRRHRIRRCLLSTDEEIST